MRQCLRRSYPQRPVSRAIGRCGRAYPSLVLIALLCLIGPLFSGHPYDQVYRDYVLVGPSVFAHPDANEVEGASPR